MTIWIKWIYDEFCERIFINDDDEKVTSYERGGDLVEYTEWYAFRENSFNERINTILEQPYFKSIFYITTTSFLTSNNEEQFLNLLDRYLSAFLSKKINKFSDDIDENKTYIRAELDFINDSFLKNKLLMERIDWNKFNNWDINSKEHNSIFSTVDYIYTEVYNKILKED